MSKPFEERVFRDPVHKYVTVQHPLIWKLIGTREMQRLRRIRQLGTGYVTFHGAEHSRFAHALGTYEITRQLVSRFGREDDGHWSREDDLISMCAALLHDVGHAPFSHSIESVFGEQHEHRSVRMITEYSEIERVLHDVDPALPSLVARVLQKTHPKRIVSSLISSQLDADRMDYLLRDAYMTGVSYGAFDLERMLRVIRPFEGRIVVTHSGKHAAEHYLLARYQMHWQVYFHPVTRSAEFVLRSIFLRAQHLWQQSYRFAHVPKGLHALFSGSMDNESFFRLDDAIVQAAFDAWRDERDPVLADLCQRFLDRHLLDYEWMQAYDEQHVQWRRDQVAKAGYDPSYYVHIDAPMDWSYAMNDDARGDSPLYVWTPEGALHEMSTQSAIVRAIQGEQRGALRLYAPRL